MLSFALCRRYFKGVDYAFMFIFQCTPHTADYYSKIDDSGTLFSSSIIELM